MAAVQKVALITAGTAGLGAAIARVLAPDFRVACLLCELFIIAYS